MEKLGLSHLSPLPVLFSFYSRILPHAPLLPPRPFPSSFFLPDPSTSHTACRSKAVARSCGSKACEIGTSSFIFGSPCSQLVYRSAIFPRASPPSPSSRFPRARLLQILASSSSTGTEHVFFTRRCARRRVMRSTCVVLWSSRHEDVVSRPRAMDPNLGVSSLLGEETGGTPWKEDVGGGRRKMHVLTRGLHARRRRREARFVLPMQVEGIQRASSSNSDRSNRSVESFLWDEKTTKSIPRYERDLLQGETRQKPMRIEG